MTGEEAVKILNERMHRAMDDWRVNRHTGDVFSDACGLVEFTAFEAIAVAEKYQREAPLKEWSGTDEEWELALLHRMPGAGVSSE